MWIAIPIGYTPLYTPLYHGTPRMKPLRARLVAILYRRASHANMRYVVEHTSDLTSSFAQPVECVLDLSLLGRSLLGRDLSHLLANLL